MLFLLSPDADAQVVLDSDSDGLLDAWEIQHFGALNHPDGDPTDNPDGDPCDNLEECNASTDPNDITDCFVVNNPDFTPGVFGNPNELKFSWSSKPNKKYHIQLAENLVDWITLSHGSGAPHRLPRDRPDHFCGFHESIEPRRHLRHHARSLVRRFD